MSFGARYDASGQFKQDLTIGTNGNVGIGIVPSSVGRLQLPGVPNDRYSDIGINGGRLRIGNDTLTGNGAIFAQGGGAILEVGAQGYISFTTGAIAGSAVEKMRINEAGNVGIGIAKPLAKLHIEGRSTWGGLAIRNADNNVTHFNYPDGKNYIRGTTIIADDGGNVGIGTTSPGYKLEVNGDIRTGAGGDIRLGSANSGTDAILYSDNGELSFYTNQDRRMVLDTSGRLGIGTPSPSSPFHILNTSSDMMRIQNSGGGEADIRYLTGNSIWEVGTNNEGNGTDKNQFYIYDASGVPNPYAFTVQRGTGNVGIGTVNPTRAKLQVAGMIGNTVASFGNRGISLVSDWPQVHFNTYWSGSGLKAMAEGYGAAITVSPHDGSMNFRMSSKANAADENVSEEYRMTLTNAGNVGIGTAAPVVAGGGFSGIDIRGANGSSVVLGKSGNSKAVLFSDSSYLYFETPGVMAFRPGGSEKMRITSDGNVGIGTTTPGATYKLDVAGAVNATDFYEAGAKVVFPVTHSLPSISDVPKWVKLGTLTIGQQGQSALIKIISNVGYNASIAQNYEAYIRFKTSNAVNIDENGFSADSSYYTTGRNTLAAGDIKWVGDKDGIAATKYGLYVKFGAYTGIASFYTVETTGGSWKHEGTKASIDPGKPSSKVLVATKEFNINSNSLVVDSAGKVGIGTPGPLFGTLQVNGNIVSARASDNTNAGFYDWYNLSNNRRWHFTMRSGDEDKLQLYFNRGTANGSQYQWDGPFLNISPNGNVGIGTTEPKAKLDVSGDIRAGNSDLYFTKIDHKHTGIGNERGFAAIENAENYKTLMILGRSGTPVGRSVSIWDYLTVNGGQTVRSGSSDMMKIENSSYGGEADIRYSNGIGDWQVGTNQEGNGQDKNQFYIYDASGVSNPYAFTVQRGTGNVGIGTTAPVVAGGGFTGIDIRGANGSSVVLGKPGNSKAVLFSDSSYLYFETPGVMAFRPGSTEKMRITSDGNVGIGTTNPHSERKLHVMGPIRMETSANAWNWLEIVGSGGALYFGTDTSNRGIWSNGIRDVGIYTDGSARILVKGDTGQVTIPGTANVKSLCFGANDCRSSWGGLDLWHFEGGNVISKTTPSPVYTNTLWKTDQTATDGKPRCGCDTDPNRTNCAEKFETKTATACYDEYKDVILHRSAEREVTRYNLYNVFQRNSTNNIGINTEAPEGKLEVYAQGGFRSGDGGINMPGDVPILARVGSDNIAFGIVNKHDYATFGIGIKDSNRVSTQRGFVALYDNYDGNWHAALTLKNGKVGIRDKVPDYALDVNGDINVAFSPEAIKNARKVALNNFGAQGFDVAELFDEAEELEPGDVVAIETSRKVNKSSRHYQDTIVGVVSSAPALVFEGETLKLAPDPKEYGRPGKVPVALAGRVLVKVSTENGFIRPGDYVTSSSQRGIAMKADKPGKAIGIALEEYSEEGEGKVLVFLDMGIQHITEEVTQLKERLSELENQVKDIRSEAK
ncbi:hypothetical protein HYV71_03625 [Candidatus Uhrbacteria bacterium]|nr:hypothetical protein [Candidatus Uhrbacteria bacterium]